MQKKLRYIKNTEINNSPISPELFHYTTVHLKMIISLYLKKQASWTFLNCICCEMLEVRMLSWPSLAGYSTRWGHSAGVSSEALSTPMRWRKLGLFFAWKKQMIWGMGCCLLQGCTFRSFSLDEWSHSKTCRKGFLMQWTIQICDSPLIFWIVL